MSKPNPRLGFTFNILFGSQENADILLAFVNSVLSLPNPLTEITLLNPYNHKTHSTDEPSILEINAKDGVSTHYRIEIQMTDKVSYDQHILHDWSKLYSQQLSEGDGFETVGKTISIHVLNSNHFDGHLDYHSIYRFLNTKTHRCAFEDLELHFIELKKFDKDLAHLTTALDKWTTFLTKAEQWERNFVPPELKSEPGIAKAAHALDEASMLKLAELKGEEKGREKGRAAVMDEVAINLLKLGTLRPDQMSAVTGIPEETFKVAQDVIRMSKRF